MSGTCNCYCCQGSGCSTSFAGSLQVSSISQCTQSFCINRFSVACKKDVFLGGHITSTFTASSPASDLGNGLLVLFVFVFLFVIMILSPKRQKRTRRFHCENCGLVGFQEEEDPSTSNIGGASTHPSCPRCRRAMLLVRIDSYDYCDYGSTSHSRTDHSSYSSTDHSSYSHEVTTSDEAY